MEKYKIHLGYKTKRMLLAVCYCEISLDKKIGPFLNKRWHGNALIAHDPQNVTCLNCLKTKKWLEKLDSNQHLSS